MIILGFDPSKSTGWTVFDTTRNRSAIECGVFELPDKADHYFTGDQLSMKVRELILSIKRAHGHVPDFAVLEAQKKSTFGNKGFDGIVYPWITTAAIVSMLAGFGIPYGTLSDSEWREYYGEGFKPPQNPVMEKDEKTGMRVQAKDKFGRLKFSNDWKAAAVNECERLGITIPTKKTIAHNACESVFIALQWRHKAMKFHAKRYMKPWQDLCEKPNKWSRLADERSAA